MKTLSRNEMAAVKRVNSTTKKLRDKQLKLSAKVEALQAEWRQLEQDIDLWEAPIKQMTNGFTSAEVLDGSWLLPHDNLDDLDVHFGNIVFDPAMFAEVAAEQPVIYKPDMQRFDIGGGIPVMNE